MQEKCNQQEAQLQLVFEPLPIPQSKPCDFSKAELNSLTQLVKLKDQQCEQSKRNYEYAMS